MRYTRKNEGFTLLELIITLSLMLMVLAIIYPFFSSNLKTLSEREAKSDLQMSAQQAMDYISKAAMETEKITRLNHGTDNLNEYENLDINNIELSTDSNIKYIFNLKDNKLLYTKNENSSDVVSNIRIADNIDTINIEPIITGETFKECKGLSIRIDLSRKNANYSAESKVYFRNSK